MIKDNEIKQLRAATGDDFFWCVCTIALEGPIRSYEDRFGGGGFQLTSMSKDELSEMTQEEARAICEEYL